MLSQLKTDKIETDKLFLNADSGFDSTNFRILCHHHEIFDNINANKRNGHEECRSGFIFDELLDKQRFVIEKTNAWADDFKALLVRFETKNVNWMSLNIIAFTTILLRKL
jgi:hypothetical protein